MFYSSALKEQHEVEMTAGPSGPHPTPSIVKLKTIITPPSPFSISDIIINTIITMDISALLSIYNGASSNPSLIITRSQIFYTSWQH
jgi:hypothetical protein